MRKLIIFLTSISFLSISTINTISCSSNTKTSSFDNVYMLGDSLTDDGGLNGILNAIINSSAIDNAKIGDLLTPSLDNSLTKNSVFSNSMDINYKDWTINEIKNKIGKTNQAIDISASSEFYNINHYTTIYGEKKSGFGFSDGDPAFALLAKKMGFNNIVPAWDTKNETIKVSDINVTASQIGNDYAIGGSIAHSLVKGSTVNFVPGVNLELNDGIYNQTLSLISQHNDLSKSLVCLDIGGNDLMNQDFANLTLEQIENGYLNDQTVSEYSHNIGQGSIPQVIATFNLLKEHKANNVIFMDAPDISTIPSYNNTKIEIQKKAHDATIFYNNNVDDAFKRIIDNSKLNWHLFSLFSELNKFIDISKNNHLNDSKYWEDNSINSLQIAKNDDGSIDIASLIHNLILNNKVEFNATLNEDDDVTLQNKDQYLFWDNVHANKWANEQGSIDLLKLFN